jgi:hypothetical protein
MNLRFREMYTSSLLFKKELEKKELTNLKKIILIQNRTIKTSIIINNNKNLHKYKNTDKLTP